jgi:hypothetical protein
MYLNVIDSYIIIHITMVVKIAISGKMCSGKSFCSKLIKQRYPQFQLFSFAEKLKSVTHDLFWDQFELVGGKENTISQLHKNRSLYVDVGQCLRDIDPDIWTKYVLKETRGVNFAIIDDLRFKNEMNALKSDGWKMIRLNINREQQIRRLQSTYINSDEHILGLDSETEKDLDDVSDSEFDLVLDQSEGEDEGGVSVYHLMSWVDELVSAHPTIDSNVVDTCGIKNDTNCCKNDCSDCDDNYKMGIVDFEKYIKDNGVIC